ncbi:restriction endonuclease subunit S [Vibrio fluvialis]|nr:restriction endonuclease subunit S [Vibrio fluvialis]
MSWQTKKLGDVCDIIKRGIAPKYLEDGGVCVINQKCIRDHAINYDLARRHDVSVKKVPQERYIKVGDVLVNSTGTGTLGRVAQVRNMPVEPSTVDTHVTIVRPKEDYFFDEFFGYMLIMIEDQITSSGEGASGQTELSRTKLEKEFFVSYPTSKSEQQKIVTILDKAFVDIEQARANTEQNLQNARELFESYLQQVFSERGEGWQKFVFSDLCEITSKLVDPRESEFLDYPHIGAANITSVTGELTEIKTAREEQLKSGKFVFDESMVLYSKIRPYLMKTCRPNFVGLCSADIYPLVPNKELITRDFLFYLLTTQHFTDYAISGSSRAGMPKVNRTHLFNYTCHIPSVEEQEMLVEKLNLMMEKSEKLQGIYQSKLAALDELKQSLLQQAFTGQLTQG